jgi:hypothetical protein
MANPYEDSIQAITGAVQNGDVKQVVDSISNVITSDTDTDTTSSVESTVPKTNSTEIALAQPVKELDYAGRKQRNEEFYAWRELVDGPYKDAEANKWAMKYHGISYAEYEKKQNEGKPKNAWEAYQGYSLLGNQEFMMSPAMGMLDFSVDTFNWATSKIRHPLNVPEIPRVAKFEDEGAQALREISSLVLPFMILRKPAFQQAGAIHKSGIAAKYAPLLYRLGNNRAFQYFAKFGLDLGVGGLTDSINKVNSQNDTLATSWIDNKWWGWQIVPESLHTGGKTPDQKHRANVLEGISLGFYTNVLESFYKLTKALKGKTAVTEYLSEAGKKSTKLNAITVDPLDNKVFDADNDLTDRLIREEAKDKREIESLTKYFVDSGKVDDIKTPTVGIHKFEETSQAGVLKKSFDGIIGAAKDQAQIATNTNTTFGRLGNTITEGFRKSGLDAENITNRTIINSLRDELVNAGKYSVKLPDGSFLSWKQIDTEGTLLAEVISDPTLPKGDLIKILDNFKESVGNVQKLNKVGYNAVNKANKRILENWADINTDKATAYFLTSEAGQISDISEGTRLVKDGKALGRANDLLLERLELFEIESKIANFNFNGRSRLLESIKLDPKNAIKYIDQLEESYTKKLSTIIPEAKNFRRVLEDIQLNAPEFSEAIRYAYEMSDGHVRTIKDINKYITNSFGFWNKAFIDKDYKIPGMLYKGLMNNVFNSILSAVGTPVKALYGNFGGFISEPVTAMYGALKAGDLQALKRSQHMYFGFTDTFQQGLKYMGKMARKAAVDPQGLKDFSRKDFQFLYDDVNIEFNEKIAEASAKIGEYGPGAILNWYKTLKAFGDSAWQRYSPIAMSGLDGFTQATQKIAMDKAQAFDLLMEKYPHGKWGQKEFDELWKNLYTKNRDAEGFIKSEAVDFAKSEIALNLDLPMTKALNPVLQEYPFLRSIFWFPRTTENVLNIFGKYSPRAGVPGVGNLGPAFTAEYAEFFGGFGNRKLKDFSLDEMITSLKKRNKFDPKDTADIVKAKFVHLRNIIDGRVAAGNLGVMSAGILFAQDRITGHGHWDPKVQKVRLNQGWQRKSIKGLDGKWHSYEFLGPIGEWIALSVTAMDNFDSIGTTRLEEFSKKMSFIFGAAYTDQSLLGTLEPVYDILSGNTAAITRWRSQMTNALYPLGSFRNELGKNLFGMLREVKNDDFGEMMRNKNNWLDIIDPLGKQPDLINFVDGKPINKAGDSIIGRTAKTVFGIGGTAGPSENGQFLIDIEFNLLPQFNTAPNGIEYTSDQKSELKKLMGEDGHFARELTKIRKHANQVTYKTPDGKRIIGYVNVMKHFRRTGNTSDSIKYYSRIQLRVENALRQAINRVHPRLTDAAEIRLEGNLQTKNEKAALRQDSNIVNQLLELN